MGPRMPPLVACLVALLAGAPAQARDLGVGLQSAYAWRQVPSQGGFTQDGSARYTFAGVRVRPIAPFQPDGRGGLDGLFIEVNAATIRIGSTNRVTVDAGLGYVFAFTPRFGLGPMVGYTRATEAAHPLLARDGDDFPSVGINIVFGRR